VQPACGGSSDDGVPHPAVAGDVVRHELMRVRQNKTTWNDLSFQTEPLWTFYGALLTCMASIAQYGSLSIPHFNFINMDVDIIKVYSELD
jgi:hypothetical protein